MISFYTTCMDRLDHLKAVYPGNLEILKRATDNGIAVNWTILNYGFTRNMDDWLKETVSPELFQDQLIRYVKYMAQVEYFLPAHAKNLAAIYSPGSLLVNLDADTWISDKLIASVKKHVKPWSAIIPEEEGHIGTIACARSDFMLVGGYNEHFTFGFGHEDRDLVRRLRLSNCVVNKQDCEIKRIDHSCELRSKHFKEQNLATSMQKHSEIQKEEPGPMVNPTGFAIGPVIINWGVKNG